MPANIISLRVNFNAGNHKGITQVLDEFEPRIRRRIRFVLEPIFGSGDSANATMNSGQRMSFMRDAYFLAEKMGYETSAADIQIVPSKTVYCYAEKESQLVVSPLGFVFKCSVQEFEPENRMGEIDENGGIVFNEKYREWMSLGESFAKVCKKCLYLPLCMGGCRNLQQKLKAGEECTLSGTNAAQVL